LTDDSLSHFKCFIIQRKNFFESNNLVKIQISDIA
jgi:hypothetical protein